MTNPRMSPLACWVTLIVAALVALLAMPYSWLLHIAAALFALSLVALLVGFVACLTYVLVGAAVGQHSGRTLRDLTRNHHPSDRY